MKPVIALVGRPNVGKSTLFNCLTQTRDALVADVPGLTRDRQFGNASINEIPYIVVDTGGLGDQELAVDELMISQAQKAMDEADILFFMIDARQGVTAADEAIAKKIRRKSKPIYVVANKVDGLNADMILPDLYRLGLGEPYAVAASHGRGVKQLLEFVSDEHSDLFVPVEEEDDNQELKIAVIGRPNVGKSTLINRLLGEERVLALDEPGTTRDSIHIPFVAKNGSPYTLIDTAGVRRRTKINETVEKFSVIKSLQAIAEANVVLHVIDAQEGVTEQDLSLLRQILDNGKALVFIINKWDGLNPDERDIIKEGLARRLSFIQFAEFHFISALHGTGVGHILKAVDAAYESAMIKLSTKKLTDLLKEATLVHQPPMISGRRSKLRYAHQGGKNPPRIVIHGNMVDKLPKSYQRYLNNHYQKRLKIKGTPIILNFKSGENPYSGKSR